MYHLYCRIYQFIFRLVSKLLGWRKPALLTGDGSIKKLPLLVKSLKISNLLIVTDKGIMNLGLLKELQTGLETEKINYFIYDKTVPNPTIDNIEEAAMMYNQNNCQAIIGFGGGTAIDCAKGVGARIARPKKSLSKMKGVLKVGKKIPTLIAVPTTAGTGSEATLAAVVTNSQTHEKYAINDIVLIPHYAVHEPMLTINLPKHITSTTGMDALTHAVEAYIGRSNTKETIEYSKKAIELIFKNLEVAYNNPKNIEARQNMLTASYYAGIAFTRAYVGNVHAMAHTLGGFYQIPHGLANAVILPYVLEFYGKKVYKSLAELADLVGLSEENDDIKTKAFKFINEIEAMNERMNIQKKISIPDATNVEVMITRAFQEANPLYPVPMILSKDDFRELFYSIVEFKEGDK